MRYALAIVPIPHFCCFCCRPLRLGEVVVRQKTALGYMMHFHLGACYYQRREVIFNSLKGESYG